MKDIHLKSLSREFVQFQLFKSKQVKCFCYALQVWSLIGKHETQVCYAPHAKRLAEYMSFKQRKGLASWKSSQWFSHRFYVSPARTTNELVFIDLYENHGYYYESFGYRYSYSKIRNLRSACCVMTCTSG